MNEFDGKAREWDKDKMHMERSRAIAVEFEKMIPLNNSMRALEYGAGTGILSFLLKDHFNESSVQVIAHLEPYSVDHKHKDVYQ